MTTGHFPGHYGNNPMKPLSKQVEETITGMQMHSSQHGLVHGQCTLEAVKEVGLWIHYFETYHRYICARELLSGARAAIAETVGYVSVGLGRAAMGAIRVQIDLLLGFTFFCDHPREWEKVQQTGDGFMLKRDIQRYHEETTTGFRARLPLIETATRATLTDVYQVLSAHIHGQSPYTIPRVGELKELILDERMMASIVDLQAKSTLVLSNYLSAIYAPQWTALPPQVVQRVRNTLTEKQRRAFFG